MTRFPSLATLALFGRLILAAPSGATANGNVTGTMMIDGKLLVGGKCAFHRDNGQLVGAKVKDENHKVDRAPAGILRVTTAASPQRPGRPMGASSSLPLPVEVTAVELFRLPEPCAGIFASYPDHGFYGIVTSGSGLYRFKANGEHKLLRRMEQPTGLIQHTTGRLLVADAAKPGVFFVSRTPTTNSFRGTSITSGTEGRPLQRPMWLLQELRHVSSNVKNAETTLACGNMYLSDLGSAAADNPLGLFSASHRTGLHRPATRLAW